MPLERANLPLEGVFRGRDDNLIRLGYKWLKTGETGGIYERYTGRTIEGDDGDSIAEFKVIRIEETDDGDYIFMGCRQEGLSGEGGHQAVWLTFDEVKAAYLDMKRYRRKSKRRQKRRSRGST